MYIASWKNNRIGRADLDGSGAQDQGNPGWNGTRYLQYYLVAADGKVTGGFTFPPDGKEAR